MRTNEITVAIIGAGPAGCAAAIQLTRFGYDVYLFEKDQIGGLLMNAHLVENYLGFPSGVSGPMLCAQMKKHLANARVEVTNEEVLSVDYVNETFSIQLKDKEIFSQHCLIATGTEPIIDKSIEIPEDCQGKVFYEVKDIAGVAEKQIGIIGAGDAAFDYAINLSLRNKVNILNRSDTIKALSPLIKEAKSIKNISYIKNISLINIISKNDKLLLNCRWNELLIEKEYDLLLFAIGRKAQKPEISESAQNSGHLFLIGDVSQTGSIRQASIASGNGIEIAMKIHLNLLGK